MTDKLTKYAAWAGLALSVVVGISLLFSDSAPVKNSLGAIGDIAIENYVPVVKNNEGLFSNYPIESAMGFIVDGVQVINGSGGLDTSASTTVGNLVYGGGINATTTPASSVLSANDFDEELLLTSSMSVGAATLTFPATTSVAWKAWGMDHVGACRDFAIENASTTAQGNSAQILTVAYPSLSQLVNSTSTLSIFPIDLQDYAPSVAHITACLVGPSSSNTNLFFSHEGPANE